MSKHFLIGIETCQMPVLILQGKQLKRNVTEQTRHHGLVTSHWTHITQVSAVLELHLHVFRFRAVISTVKGSHHKSKNVVVAQSLDKV